MSHLFNPLHCTLYVCVMMILWQSVLEGLVQKNHITQLLPTPDSVVQAVVRQGERLCAESDPRKGGYPAGYWAWLQDLLFSSKTLGQSFNTNRCLHWRLKQYLSHGDTATTYSNMENDSNSKPFLLELSNSAFIFFLFGIILWGFK